jgi:hypothetical protein
MVSHLSPTRNKKPFKSIPKMDPRPIPTLLETPQSFRKTLGLDFLPDSKQLGVATSFSAVYIFDLVTQKLAPWSEGQGFPLKTLPNELANRKESPLRLSMNPSDPTKLMNDGTYNILHRNIYFPCKEFITCTSDIVLACHPCDMNTYLFVEQPCTRPSVPYQTWVV